MSINASLKRGFTLVEIMIVVAIIGLLAAIAIPNFIKARTTAQCNACINNLRQMDGAAQEWALELKQAPGTAVASTDVTAYIKLDSNGNIPGCPAAGTYASWTVGTHPTCSLSTASPAHQLP
jgi:prepilin-type N-terminal cleavage/methylation domain-containing protein